MGQEILLIVFLQCTSIYLVNSAPSQASTGEEPSAFPVDTVQELGSNADFHFVNTTNTNSNKSSGTGNFEETAKNIAEIYNLDEKLNKQNGEMDYLNVPAIGIERQEAAQSNVMTLSDDVITDALFTNIDILQDHLEVCEEGLRQKLKLHSHGKLLQEITSADIANRDSGKPNGDDNEDDEGTDNDQDYEGEEDDLNNVAKDNESYEEIDDYEDNEAQSSNVKAPSSPNIPEEKARVQRSVTRTSPGGQRNLKAAVLAQKVVNRLSSRLEYLKSSLAQCHLLYKQFELL